jgi:hypothetical protein
MTRLLPPDEPLLGTAGGPKRPPPEATSWFITVMCGPKPLLVMMLSLCESKLVWTSMECCTVAEALELSRLKHGVDETEDPDRCIE